MRFLSTLGYKDILTKLNEKIIQTLANPRANQGPGQLRRCTHQSIKKCQLETEVLDEITFNHFLINYAKLKYFLR